MGDLIDLFTGQVTPESEEDAAKMDAVGEGEEDAFLMHFRDAYLGNFLNAVRGLEEADNVGSFEEFIQEIKDEVARWPVVTSS